MIKKQEEKKGKISKKIKTKKTELEWKAKYQRALADYQNLLKQTEKERIDFVKYANDSLLQEIIPVYDHLKLSLQHLNHENNSWLEGIKYVLQQFKTILEAKDVREVKTIGEQFNPETMEAVENIATGQKEEDQLVAKELKPGYQLHERTIIPARVAVYQYKEEEKEKQKEQTKEINKELKKDIEKME